MYIESFPSGPFETNAYVIGCEKTGEAFVIDPGVGSAEPISTFLRTKGLDLTAIILTHSHWDHIANVAELKEAWNAPVSIHPEDAPNLEAPGTDGLRLWIPIQGVKPDRLLNEGESLSVGNYPFQVIHTPGHSPGGVCFYCAEEKILFSGDTLFQGTIGNLSFATAEPERMWASLAKLAELPKETRVYPGHGEKTTIGEEAWLPQAKSIFGSTT